jgi:hypothetical protein
MIGPEEIYAENVRPCTISSKGCVPDSIKSIGTKLLEDVLRIMSTIAIGLETQNLPTTSLGPACVGSGIRQS